MFLRFYSAAMIVQWIRNRRRAKIAKQSFPDHWNDIIRNNVHHVQYLTNEQADTLRFFVQVFVAEKYWEGCDGQNVDDEVKVTIAAQAGLLALGKYPVWFDHVLSILVYPDEHLSTNVDDSNGIVTESAQMQLGEAVWQGPVILSWIDVLAGGRREDAGHNLVLHEFAHQLDMANGQLIDGVPPLQTQQELDNWVRVMSDAYGALHNACQSGIATAIDCYGTGNVTEFYSVATEAFFDNPNATAAQCPALYQLLKEYYGLDPASWSAGR